jgi:hypothetical protein
MLNWSKPNAIVPDEPLRWILAALRFYAIAASVGIALAVAVISILAFAPAVLQLINIVDPNGTGVVLVALIILFGAATYFTGRLYVKVEYIAYGVGFVIVPVVLFVLWLSLFGHR